MTSKNSFWANCKENHKRRIWVWIVAFLAQTASYVGVLSVYLSRIRMWYVEEHVYQTYEEYQNALRQGTRDALGFQDNLAAVMLALSFIIGAQGFSYLYDRKKVDLYHSVPVNKNRRFAVVYVNGIMIYLVPTLISLLCGIVTAVAWGAVNGEALAVIGLAFWWNLLYFLVLYHTVIFAVMITGNRFITLCVAGGLALYETYVYQLIDNMKYAYFETVSNFYVAQKPGFSVFYDYFMNVWDLKRQDNVKELARVVLPYYGKWFILAVVMLAAAWLSYRKRPSEAAGRAIAFAGLKPIIKVAAVIPIGLGLGMWVRNAAYGSSTMLTVAGMILSGVIACAAIEVIYDFDIKSLFRHLISSGVAVAGIVIVFLVFWQDLFGYDRYVPKESDVASIALNLDYYGQFWDDQFSSIGLNVYSRDRMFITDAEPVLALAGKAQQADVEKMGDPRNINVLYRLKSGREVGRRFLVDFADPGNEAWMNRIMGTQEFKEGTFQIMTDDTSCSKALQMTYSNGAAKVALPIEDAPKLREAYVRDMEKFDFTLAAKSRPCGRISIRFPEWMDTALDVYDSFENTLAYLKSREAYYPVQLNPEDIADITVTNYHNELYMVHDDPAVYNAAPYTMERAAVASSSIYAEDTTVSETFSDPAELSQIVQAIYPAYLTTAWNDHRDLDENYDVYITFEKDTTYPYDRSSYGVYYKFYTGQAPEFVVEATALEERQE